MGSIKIDHETLKNYVIRIFLPTLIYFHSEKPTSPNLTRFVQNSETLKCFAEMTTIENVEIQILLAIQAQFKVMYKRFRVLVTESKRHEKVSCGGTTNASQEFMTYFGLLAAIRGNTHVLRVSFRILGWRMIIICVYEFGTM